MFVATEPGAPETVTTYARSLAGAETNVAAGLARLGHQTGWVGRVGDDPFGGVALIQLAEMVEVINDLAGRADWVLPGPSEGALLSGRTDAAGVAATTWNLACVAL